MERIQSADGTPIAFDRTGSGPPLVIVLGAFCDRATSKALASLLAARYTVYEYDRRGRGDSGNGLPLDTAAEVEDLAAILEAASLPAFVYGHSSGGLLALEAAARGVPMCRLAVYEPPYTGEHDPGPGFGDRLDQLVARGQRDQAAEEWLVMTGTPRPVIDLIKSGPGWARRQALAHTLSEDLRLANHGQVPVERFERIAVPVLALAGGASPPWAGSAIAEIAAALPQASSEIVAGEHHIPADSVIAAILERFFQRSALPTERGQRGGCAGTAAQGLAG